MMAWVGVARTSATRSIKLLIPFVPNRGDHGELALRDRPDHRLVVEAPKIFHRSATAGDQDGFDTKAFRICIHRRNGFCDTRRASSPWTGM